MFRYLLSKNRSQQLSMFALVVLATLAALMPIHLFRLILDQAIPAHDVRLLSRVGLALAIVLALAVWLEFAKAVMARRIQEFFVADLRLELMTHIMSLRSEYFSANPVGKLLNRIMHDVSRFGMGIEWLLVNPAIALSTICVYTVYLLSIDPRLTLIALLPLPLTMYASARISSALSRHRLHVSEAASNYSASVNEVMLASVEIQSNGSHHRERRRLAREHRVLEEAGIRESALLARLSSVSAGYRNIVPVVVYCYGGWLALSGELSIGRIVAFSAAFAGLYSSIDTLINYMPLYQNVRDRYAQLREILDVPAMDNAQVIGAPSPAVPADTTLVLEGVSFSHASGARIIDSLNLTIRAGEHVAIIGRSGCGKSTLLNLVAGRLAPYSGTLRYGDITHRSLTVDLRVKLISYVQQTPFLFSGLLRDNLLYGARGDDGSSSPFSDAELLAACRRIGLDSDLFDLGIETRLPSTQVARFAALRVVIGANAHALYTFEAWNDDLTIRQNLTPRGSDLDDLAVRRTLGRNMANAINAAGLDDTLRGLALGFDVGERGSRLSGGQRQKVSILRALLRKRPLLLLDEVTASLDEASANTVLRLLRTEMRDTTVLAITHELDTLTSFDRVIALGEGEVLVDMPAAALLKDRALLDTLFARTTGEPR